MSYCDGLLIYLINLINRLQLEENSAVRLVTPSLPSSPSPVGWVEGGTLHRYQGVYIGFLCASDRFLKYCYWLIRLSVVWHLVSPETYWDAGIWRSSLYVRPWGRKAVPSKILVKIYIFPTVKSALLLLFYIFNYCWLDLLLGSGASLL